MVGGLDGPDAGTRAVLDLLHGRIASWRPPSAIAGLAGGRGAVRAARTLRSRAGAPAAGDGPPVAFPPEKGYFDAPEFREARYLWRWVAMVGPDLVIDVRDGAALEWRANALAAGRVAGQRAAAARLARRRARERRAVGPGAGRRPCR